MFVTLVLNDQQYILQFHFPVFYGPYDCFPMGLMYVYIYICTHLREYVYTCIYMYALTRVCTVYVIKEVTSFWGGGGGLVKLMGMARKITCTQSLQTSR